MHAYPSNAQEPDITAGWIKDSEACNARCMCQINFITTGFQCATHGAGVAWSSLPPSQTRSSANCNATEIPEQLIKPGNKFYFAVSVPKFSTNVLKDFLQTLPSPAFVALEFIEGFPGFAEPILEARRDSLLSLDLYDFRGASSSYTTDTTMALMNKLKVLEILYLRGFALPVPDNADFESTIKFFRLIEMSAVLKLPSWVARAPNLEYLGIIRGSRNFTLSLPRLPKLHTFAFSYMYIKEFTIKLREVSLVLQQVDFSSTPIEVFAEDTFANLTLLNNVDVSGTLIQTLTPFYPLKNLKTLYMNGLPATSRKFGKTFFINFPHLRELSLSQNPNLIVDDDAFTVLPELEIVDVSRNNFSTVPNFLMSCSLRIINMDYNVLNSSDCIPYAAVAKWVNLYHFSYRSNLLTVVPSTLFLIPFRGTNIKEMITYSATIQGPAVPYNYMTYSRCEMYKLYLSGLDLDFFGTTMSESEIKDCRNSYDTLIAKLKTDLIPYKNITSCPTFTATASVTVGRTTLIALAVCTIIIVASVQ